MLGGLFVTVSRAGWAAAALGLLTLLVALLFNRDFRLKAIVAIVIILIPATWLGVKSAKAQQRINKAFTGGKFGDDRFYVWKTATVMWHEHFWTGVGPGLFDTHFRALRPPLSQLQVRPDRVHNDYLNVLADWGMIGFSLILVAWGVFWLGVARIWRFVRRANDFGSKQSTRAAMVLGACAGMVALLTHISVDFDMHIPAIPILLVTLLAIITGHWRFATERFWVNPGVLGRIAATIFCLVSLVWLGRETYRNVGEQIALSKAERLPETDPSHLKLLQEAYAFEANNPQTAFLIGESFRKLSWSGAAGYEKQAQEAITWFNRGIPLNPYDPHCYLGRGMCLHWLGQHDEAWPDFRKIMLLDPNSYYVRAHYGWHFMQFRAWRPAAHWFLYSLFLRPKDNPVAEAYYEIARRKVEEEKTALVPGTVLPTEQ
jgi:hypothetical protein